MSNHPVQIAGVMNDKIKIVIALLACAAGIVGYYFFINKPMLMRAGVLIAGLAVGAIFAWFSETGRNFLVFARESVRETRKVVWPERKDAIRVTAIVFGFAVIMALFLFGTDKVLEMVLYDFILGWNR
ncbi:preprotein translocase subunit SecE [Oxalobacter vibrioformis]|uniref:Protein translocase subunit SecE n=1 Tax=Oxalobacter vibrioformis TaxID=933080 RepID=A0A9E9P4Q4_9BURK|nr:preprotein translocase subunit SecE [Oxalobacter vibrioformis]NLC22947.1 preprotein translocase subunit SecE [Oxalobacter sp.]WAW11323.1 preprotein translocase subunit SecE [Oxalobacter vibrioformis]